MLAEHNNGCLAPRPKTCCCWPASTSMSPLTRAAVDLDDLAFEEGLPASLGHVEAGGHVGVEHAAGARAMPTRLRRIVRERRRECGSGHAVAGRIGHARRARRRGGASRSTRRWAGDPRYRGARVLQRFVRLDEKPARATSSSGLGLSIVDEVVRAHGGWMSIEQSPLGGARIVITLPVQAVVS